MRRILLGVLCAASSADAANPERRAAAPEPQAQIDHAVGEIMDLFLDLQFDRAEAAASRLKARYPGYPAGDFYHSVVLYQRLLMQQQESVDAVRAYETFNGLCVASAQAYRSQDPATSELYLSAAYGMHARVFALEKRYLDAIKQALKSVHHVKLAIKLRPERDDSYLGLGVFNYFMSAVPIAVRPLAFFLVSSWGDRELGLMQLERVAEKGVANRAEAQCVLAAAYSSDREQAWDKSDALLEELMRRHPHNHVHRLRRVYVAERRGRYDLAVKLADPGGEWVKTLPLEVREKARASARYRAAESLLLSGKAAEAALQLESVGAASLSARMRAWVALRRGNVLDAAGQKAAADVLYRSLRSGEASREAKEFWTNRFPRGPKTVMPFEDGVGLIR